MTKPIEGWVVVTADREVSVYTDIEDPRSDHIAIYLRKQPGLDYRPVLVMFANEIQPIEEETLKKIIDHLKEEHRANLRKYGDSINPLWYQLTEADAIRKERERIMKIFYDTMHEEFHPDYRDLLCEDFKRDIFGEEK